MLPAGGTAGGAGGTPVWRRGGGPTTTPGALPTHDPGNAAIAARAAAGGIMTPLREDKAGGRAPARAATRSATHHAAPTHTPDPHAARSAGSVSAWSRTGTPTAGGARPTAGGWQTSPAPAPHTSDPPLAAAAASAATPAAAAPTAHPPWDPSTKLPIVEKERPRTGSRHTTPTGTRGRGVADASGSRTGTPLRGGVAAGPATTPGRAAAAAGDTSATSSAASSRTSTPTGTRGRTGSMRGGATTPPAAGVGAGARSSTAAVGLERKASTSSATGRRVGPRARQDSQGANEAPSTAAGGIAVAAAAAPNTSLAMDDAAEAARAVNGGELPPGAVQPVSVRKRLPRIPRSALGRAAGNGGSAGRIAGAVVRCIVAADTTVWCAEASGNITIREKNGAVFGVVRRASGSSAVTTMLFVPGSFGASRVIVGHANGTIAALDAGKGERKSGDVAVHHGAVTAMAVLPHNGGIVTAGEDGAIYIIDPANLASKRLVGSAPSGITSLAPAPFRLYAGTAHGDVQAWDINACAVKETATLAGGVNDMVYTGKYLWIGCRGAPIAVLDSADLSVVTNLGKADTTARIIQCSNASVWSFHGNGAVQVWNAQTLELVRSMKYGATGPTGALARVACVPEDVEVWSCNPLESAVRTWRDADYAVPVWCVEGLDEANERCTALQKELAQATRKISALDTSRHGGNARAVEEENAALKRELETLKKEQTLKLEAEASRRRRAESELTDLRALVANAYKKVYGEKTTLSRHSVAELRDMVSMLREAASRSADFEEDAQQAAEELAVLRAENAAAQARLQDTERSAAQMQAMAAKLEQTQFRLDTALRKLAQSEADRDAHTAEVLYQQQQVRTLAQREQALQERERVQYEHTESLAQKEAEIAEMEIRLMREDEDGDSPGVVLPASVLPAPTPPEPQPTAILDAGTADSIVLSGASARREARAGGGGSPTRGPVNLTSPARPRASMSPAASPAGSVTHLRGPSSHYRRGTSERRSVSHSVSAAPEDLRSPSPHRGAIGAPGTPASTAALGERERQVDAAEQGLLRLKQLLEQREEAVRARESGAPAAAPRGGGGAPTPAELRERERRVGIAEKGLRELRESLGRREEAVRRRELAVAESEGMLLRSATPPQQQQQQQRSAAPSMSPSPPPPAYSPDAARGGGDREASLAAREHQVRADEAALAREKAALAAKAAALQQPRGSSQGPQREGASPPHRDGIDAYNDGVNAALLSTREEHLGDRERALDTLQQSLQQRENHLRMREERLGLGRAGSLPPRGASLERGSSVASAAADITARLDERERDLTAREEKLAGHLAAVEELEAVHNAREAALTSREAAATAHERDIAQREDDLAAREAAVAAAEGQKAEDDARAQAIPIAHTSTASSAASASCRAREKGLIAREKALASREQELLAREAEVIDREDAVGLREERVAEETATATATATAADAVEEQRVALAAWEDRLAAREDALAAKEMAAAEAGDAAEETTAALEAWEGRLGEQEARLDGREAALAERHAALAGKEETLEGREGAVAAREESATRQEQELTSKHEVLEAKEDALAQRAVDLGETEDAVAQREADVASREEAVMEKERENGKEKAATDEPPPRPQAAHTQSVDTDGTTAEGPAVLAALEDALAGRDERIATLREEIADYVAQVEALTKEKEEREQQPPPGALKSLQSFERELGARDARVQELEQELDAAEAHARLLEEQVASSAASIDTIQSRLSTAVMSLRGKQAALDAAEASLRESQAALTDACHDAEQLKRYKDDAQRQRKQIDELQREQAILVGDLERARDDLHDARERVERLTHDSAMAAHAAEQRIKQLEDAARTNTSGAADAAVATRELAQAQEELRTAGHEIRSLKQKLDGRVDGAGDAAHVAALQRKYDIDTAEMREQISGLEKDKARLKDMLEKLNKAQKKVNEHLRVMGTQIEEKDKQITELMQQRRR